MEKREYLIILYDFYSELLSDKQKEHFEDYYFNNLSLGEISENENVSRNAIHKSIKSIENKLYAYIGGICRELECNPVAIGGHNDHIHILCLLSRKIALFNLVEHVKARSSKWIKTQGEEFSNFYWQDGYGAFSYPVAES